MKIADQPAVIKPSFGTADAGRYIMSGRIDMMDFPRVSLKASLAVASHAGRVPVGDALSPAHAIAVLAALAQPTRLAIFKLLLKHEPVGLMAGVIADTVGAPHNSISTHLATLVRAGLLRAAREGRSIIYRADIEGMRALVGFLVNDCCDGHPELCKLLDTASDNACGCPPPGKRKSRRSGQ